MKTFITLPREIEIEGYKATVNIKFQSWDRVGGKSSYYCSVSETAKCLKALAKSMGFEVISAKSESYSGGDSVDLTLKSELTEEQKEHNKVMQTRSYYETRCGTIPEPRQDLANKLEGYFKAGHFNGMEDIYEYSK